MKKIIYTITLLSVLLVGCDKDEEKTVLDPNAQVASTVSANSVILSKDNASAEALSVSWETKDVNLVLSQTLSVVFQFGNKIKEVSVTESPLKINTETLNNYLTGDLGLPSNKESEIDVFVKNSVSDKYALPTKIHKIKVTPYRDLILPTAWGVVGSATPNEWNGPDVPFWKLNGSETDYVAYLTLKDGEIKFRKDNKWDMNLGGSNGTLTEGGSNIKVTAGTYKIVLNVEAKTYTIEKYTWGIVGDGANGWDENQDKDIKLAYDGTTDSWKAENVTLKDGQIKFRLNNTWAVNYGADASTEPAPEQSGTLAAGGKNIKSAAGKYNVTFSFDETTKKGTYKLEKL